MLHSITELPRKLAPVVAGGRTALWHWRNDLDWTGGEAATYFGVSPATYYRYENGVDLPLRKANVICRKTNGKIKYSDLLADFNTEYA